MSISNLDVYRNRKVQKSDKVTAAWVTRAKKFDGNTGRAAAAFHSIHRLGRAFRLKKG